MATLAPVNNDSVLHCESDPCGWHRNVEMGVVTRALQCAVKGAGPQREINPPGNWIAPPGSNWSGGGGNKAAGASDIEGRTRRLGESAGCNASER